MSLRPRKLARPWAKMPRCYWPTRTPSEKFILMPTTKWWTFIQVNKYIFGGISPLIYVESFQWYIDVLIAHTSALEMTQLSNVLITIICFDSMYYYQRSKKLSVIKTFNNCVISKADVWAISWNLFVVVLIFFFLNLIEKQVLRYLKVMKNVPKYH